MAFRVQTYGIPLADAARDYAEIRFADHVERFERLALMADRVHTGGKLDAEETEFLEDCRRKDAAFPELDLSYWAKLDKAPVPVA